METHNIFTHELMEEILLRLSVRHLLRLRCVSKSWRVLIDNTGFIKKHHQIQSAVSQEEGDLPLFLINQSLSYDEKNAEFYLLSKKQGDAIMCLTPDLDRDRVPNDNPDHFSHLHCMGVVNGVVGLCWGEECLSLGLWNPATRDFKVVPPPWLVDSYSSMEFGVNILGLGFDPKSNDFKIITSMYCNGATLPSCEIYSLNDNSWTNIELPPIRHSFLFVNFPRTDMYYNGTCYWTAAEVGGDESPLRYVIVFFDFSTEALKYFDPPPAVVTAAENMGDFDWMIWHYMELLVLIFSQKNSVETLYSFEIWAARKIVVGVDSEISLSWQHLFTIGPLNGLYAEAFVAFRMNADVLLNIYQGRRKKCYVYNPYTRTFKTLGLSFHSGYRYVESLFPLSKRPIQSYQELNNEKKRKLNRVLERYKFKYEETNVMQDDACSRPTTSYYTDDSFSGTRTHNCSCCHELDAMKQQLNELDSIKQQFGELRKVVASIVRGEPIPAWMLTENSNPPVQLPPPLSP